MAYLSWTGPEWSLVYVTVLLVAVTALLAWFTYRLWNTTKEMVAKSDAGSRDTAAKMERSIAETARAAAAVERFASSMQESASAASEGLKVATRTMVAAHPPIITVETARITPGRGQMPMRIRYWIRNKGRSCARLRWAVTEDFIHVGPPPVESPRTPAIVVRLEGEAHLLSPGKLYDAQHQCTVLTDADRTPTAVPSAREPKRMLFWCSVSYVDEAGDEHTTSSKFEFIPPSLDLWPQVLP